MPVMASSVQVSPLPDAPTAVNRRMGTLRASLGVCLSPYCEQVVQRAVAADRAATISTEYDRTAIRAEGPRLPKSV